MLANQPAELDDVATTTAAADTTSTPDQPNPTNFPASAENQQDTNVYQNNDVHAPSAEYTNLESTTAFRRPAAAFPAAPPTNQPPSTDYYNFGPITAEVQQQHAAIVAQPPPRPAAPHDPKRSHTRKIPDNLTLTDTALLATGSATTQTTVVGVAFNGGAAADADLSPAASTASGPYIPISECYTGNTTPLNTLDPRFGVEWRSSHTNGVNQICEQPYSPKHSNVMTAAKAAARQSSKSAGGGGGGRSSPSDPESVFSDDEEWHGKQPPAQPRTLADADGAVGAEAKTRSQRPSDSSVENDSLVYITYKQRFSKMPNGESTASAVGPVGSGASTSSAAAAAAAVAKSVVEPWIEASAFGSADTLDEDEVSGAHAKNTSIGGQPQSDTENASPAIGPKDVSCVSNAILTDHSDRLYIIGVFTVRRRKLRHSAITSAAVPSNGRTAAVGWPVDGHVHSESAGRCGRSASVLECGANAAGQRVSIRFQRAGKVRPPR